MIRNLLYFSLLLFLMSCAAQKQLEFTSNASPTLYPFVDLKVELSRSAMRLTEYERYQIKDEKLLVECGKLSRGRPVPETLKVIPLSVEEMGRINAAASGLRTLIEKKEFLFDAPGDNRSPLDPGIALLKVNFSDNILQIQTSLDSLVPPSHEAGKRLKTILENVRGLVKEPLCGNIGFYRIGKSQ